MTISQVASQAGGVTQDASATVDRAFPGNVTAGNLVWFAVSKFDAGVSLVAGDLTKQAGTATIDTPTLDKVIQAGNLTAAIFSALVTGTGSLTLRCTSTAGSYWVIGSDELASDVGWGASRVEDSDSANATATPQVTPAMVSAGKAAFVGVTALDDGLLSSLTEQAAFARVFLENNGAAHAIGVIFQQIVSTGTTDAAESSTTADGAQIYAIAGVVYKETAGGASAEDTGTATEDIVKADVVAGGKTLISTLIGDTWAPAQTISDISFIANALGGTTDTTSFSITLPATQAGDLIILEFSHRGTGNGTIGGTYTGPAFTLKHSQLFGSSAFSGKTYWSRATGDHAAQTVTGSGLTNACAAIVTIYRGTAASGDPLADATIVGEENASGDETQAEITTATDKAWVVLVVVNSPDLAVATQACTSPGTLTERAERLSTGGTDASIAHASAAKASAGATGALTWTQTNAASGSWAYAIKPNVTTPFADSRSAQADGLLSDGSETHGWNADVVAALQADLSVIVRTSDTVRTITLPAVAAYNITAPETIEDTIPGTALAGGSPIVATPTFTVDVAAAESRRVPVRNVSQAVNRASSY